MFEYFNLFSFIFVIQHHLQPQAAAVGEQGYENKQTDYTAAAQHSDNHGANLPANSAEVG